MSRLLNAIFLCVTVCVLFTVVVVAAVPGNPAASPPGIGNGVAPSAPVIAHGPTFPPDPWEDGSGGTKPHRSVVQLAHGPTFPPDPWEDGSSTKPHPFA